MNGIINDTKINDKLFFVRKLIERNGYKFTKQRKVILEQFLLADRHLSVEQIYERVKKNNIGLATVYRNVNIFNKIGIVKEINADGVSYYELKIYSKKPLHIHFRCVRCNAIIDIDEKQVSFEYLKLNKIIEDMNDVEIYDADIMLIGLCKKCRGK